ncbi:Na(+)/H(+) antiporter subunit G [Koleobacter methoxysyntrophicus]|uniref:Na(+)/H(+) antiporter subunit G n=1 Tax=Koleobacter methoxysyntrophicus TaxID=2751313 RepID=A0A8A0RKW9_9FIRM|nr:monovalent cation/H(+) antiporter subunit G [Koleobacter methoxysyntrophicus]QSQ08364.1 Na(+)/H(+) antiporter subunit G [Koleobacter methoxysyntrophicus]
MTVLVGTLLFTGIFFLTVGTIGLLRFPDVYTRIHATTKCDTLGLGLVLVSLMFISGLSWDSVKLLFVIIFVWLTNPTAAHVISKAAYKRGIPMAEGSFFINKEEKPDGNI